MTKRYAICYNPKMPNSEEVMEKLKSVLDKSCANYTVLDTDNCQKGFDFVFVIGGDGTILKTARFYSEFDTPIFGINLGRLGFLSQASMADIEVSVDKILKFIENKRNSL